MIARCTCPDDGVMRLADADQSSCTIHCMCHSVEVEGHEPTIRMNRHEKRKKASGHVMVECSIHGIIKGVYAEPNLIRCPKCAAWLSRRRNG